MRNWIFGWNRLKPSLEWYAERQEMFMGKVGFGVFGIVLGAVVAGSIVTVVSQRQKNKYREEAEHAQKKYAEAVCALEVVYRERKIT